MKETLQSLFICAVIVFALVIFYEMIIESHASKRCDMYMKILSRDNGFKVDPAEKLICDSLGINLR